MIIFVSVSMFDRRPERCPLFGSAITFYQFGHLGLCVYGGE